MEKSYIPKVNDVVFMKAQNFVRYVVAKVYDTAKRSDVQAVSGAIILHRDIPWPELYELDEGQTAAPIVI
jgi:hypothetical protein